MDIMSDCNCHEQTGNNHSYRCRLRPIRGSLNRNSNCHSEEQPRKSLDHILNFHFFFILFFWRLRPPGRFLHLGAMLGLFSYPKTNNRNPGRNRIDAATIKPKITTAVAKSRNFLPSTTAVAITINGVRYALT